MFADIRRPWPRYFDFVGKCIDEIIWVIMFNSLQFAGGWIQRSIGAECRILREASAPESEASGFHTAPHAAVGKPPVCPSPSLRHRPMSVRGLCRPAGLTVLEKRIPPSYPYGLSVLEALVPYALSSLFVWPFLLVLMANAQLIAEIESRDLRSVNSNRSLLFILYSLIIYFCRYECKEQLNAANEELAMIVSCLRRCFVRWYLDSASASQMFSLGYWLAGVDWPLD